MSCRCSSAQKERKNDTTMTTTTRTLTGCFCSSSSRSSLTNNKNKNVLDDDDFKGKSRTSLALSSANLRASGKRRRGARTGKGVIKAAAEISPVTERGGGTPKADLESSRGACSVVSPKYSPESIRQKTLFNTPFESVQTFLRLIEITWSAGVFAGSLLYDEINGVGDRNVGKGANN